MKKLIHYSILPLATILMLVIYHNTENKLTEREKYEHFLAGEYKNVPDLSKEELKGMPKPTRPDLAAIQNFFVTLDPELGRVPTERLKDAIQKTESIRYTGFKSSGSLEWEGTEANMGGRTRAIMFDPNDAGHKEVWAGGVTGGLWYNDDITDEDNEWEPVGDYWASLSISCITYDPNDTDVFYVGTGEAQTAFTTYRESSGVGVGIFKSDDGGDSWELMPSTTDFKYVTDIVVRDENGQSVIYAGVASGYYHGQAHQSIPSDGLYRSDDNGQSWQQVLPNLQFQNKSYAVADIALGADGRLYVGTSPNIAGDGGAVILYSDDGTEDSWTVFSDYVSIIENNWNFYLPGRVMLAPAPSDPNIIYALIAAGYTSDNNGFNYYHCRYMLKSTDKGETWSEISYPMNSGTSFANLAWHALTGAVNPENPDNIYVGGLDVWNTLSGGDYWYHTSDWALMYYGGGPDYVHADQHLQIYRPENPDEMLFGTDGGVFYTDNSESTNPVYEERNNGYNTLQFYTCDISPIPGDEKYVGGLQDNGTLLYQGWPLTINDMLSGGDGAYCFFDEDQPELLLTSVYYNRYYVWEDGDFSNYFDEWESGIFINPADYNSESNTLYANAVMFNGNLMNHILRVKNVDESESGDFLPLTTASSAWFSHVKYSPYSPDDSDNLFLGTNSGRLYKVTNADTDPVATEITGDDFPLGSISCIALGGSEDVIMVTFSNYGVSSIWQSTDGGETWAEKEGNLPDMPVRWAVYHPEGNNQALLATELGVWETFNLHEENTSWVPADDGLANVRVDMLQLREADNTVLAATHGRGFYTAEYNYFPNVGVNENIAGEIQMYPNPATDEVNISLGETDQPVEISLYSMDGKLVRSREAKGSAEIKLNVSGLERGNYILRMNDGEKTISEKLLLQ